MDKAVLFYAVSYLIGSVTVGPLLARLRGVDLRAVGSGNIGATNVARALGRREALVTLVGDGLKGAAAVWLARWAGLGGMDTGLCGFCAIMGHNFPVWLAFRGGKGVATSLGVIAAWLPLSGLAFAVVWITAFRVWRISSLAALAAFLGTLCVTIVRYRESLGVVFAMTLLAVVMHRENIRRLLAGEEPRFGGAGRRPEESGPMEQENTAGSEDGKEPGG